MVLIFFDFGFFEVPFFQLPHSGVRALTALRSLQRWRSPEFFSSGPS